VHRDVKPANILFRADGAAVLSDFGIVRKLEDDGTQLTKQGYAVGTPAYMSPEQILGKKVDARSDLYSLGVLFHEMLTGKKPFQADETFALALKHISEPVPRLPEPYSRFQGILDTLMAKEPEQRFEDAAKMIHAIDDINKPGRSANLPETSPLQLPPDNDTTVIVDADSPATPRKSPDRNRSRFIWLTGVVAAATVAAGGVAAYLTLVPLTSSIQVCESPELSGSETDQITQLTEIADLNRDVGRLVDPPVSNAAYGYQEILKLDPCNKHAKAELDKIAQTYLDKAKENQQQNGDPRDTLNLIDAGLLASPRHEVLQKLKNEVSQKLRQN
jgi:serine/threonine-protein kinase PpkA